jgi:hypothetical protein
MTQKKVRVLIPFFIFYFFIFVQQATAQSQRKYIVGRVVDPENLKGVDRASVMNMSTRHLVKTNESGRFSILAGEGDSLIVTSLTHGRNGISYDGTMNEPVIYSRKLIKAIELPEVKIRGKREEQLEKEIREILAEPERTTKLSGDRAMELIQSPISLLYEAFSRRAKSDRKVLVLMQQDRRRKLAEFRQSMIAGRATNLRGDELERFMTFCDFREDFLLTSSEYQLTYETLRAFEEFKRKQ